MAGYDVILRLRTLEESLSSLGMVLAKSKHHTNSMGVASVIPKDEESLPIYSRDAELFTGSIEEIEIWLQGVKWARWYDQALFGKKLASRRSRREQDERNLRLVELLSK